MGDMTMRFLRVMLLIVMGDSRIDMACGFMVQQAVIVSIFIFPGLKSVKKTDTAGNERNVSDVTLRRVCVPVYGNTQVGIQS